MSRIIKRVVRHFSSSFYDSQSGRYMSIPGTAGVRFHDMSFRFKADLPILKDLSQKEELDKIFASKPTMVEVGRGEIMLPSLTQNLPFAAMIALSSHHDVIDVDCSQLSAAGLQQVCEKIDIAAEDEKNVRVNLIADMLEKDALSKIDKVVNAVVDSSAVNYLFLMPIPNGNVTEVEDKCTVAVEMLLNLDVVGDPMMERIGFVGSLSLCRAVHALGVTRFGVCLEGHPYIPTIDALRKSINK